MSENRPSLKDIAKNPRVKSAAAVAGLTVALGGVALIPGTEEAMRPHPQTNEIYKGGDVVINLKTADARTSNIVVDKNSAPNTVQESDLAINGQSLAGVDKIKVHNPRIVETDVAKTRQNPGGKVLSILIPFDNGQEVYYRYGDGSIQFMGKGSFVKGLEQTDGSFQSTDGQIVPKANIGSVEVLPNAPAAPAAQTNPQ